MKTRVLNCKVAGVSYDGRQDIIASLTGNEPCRISPEPLNKFDPNALAVHIATSGGVMHVGYIPREIAAQIAPHLEGEAAMADIAEITGGWDDGIAFGLRIRVEIPDEQVTAARDGRGEPSAGARDARTSESEGDEDYER